MKSIKCFKYWYSYEFEKCLEDYGYTLDDVEGFSISSIRRCRGNILKIYKVYVYEGEGIYFSVAYFKSFDEYNKCWLGFNGDRLLNWYKTSIINLYKADGEYVRD